MISQLVTTAPTKLPINASAQNSSSLPSSGAVFWRSRVEGNTTLASVNRIAPERITKKNPAEKPKPCSRYLRPSTCTCSESNTENSAPMVMNPPASIDNTSICGTEVSRMRWIPCRDSSSMTYSDDRYCGAGCASYASAMVRLTPFPAGILTAQAGPPGAHACTVRRSIFGIPSPGSLTPQLQITSGVMRNR